MEDARVRSKTYVRNEGRLGLLVFQGVPVDCRHPWVITNVVDLELFSAAKTSLSVAVEELRDMSSKSRSKEADIEVNLRRR